MFLRLKQTVYKEMLNPKICFLTLKNSIFMKTRKSIQNSKLVKFSDFQLSTKKNNKILGGNGATTTNWFPLSPGNPSIGNG